MERVALIGTGTMGAPIAANLAGAGRAVAVWNRTRAKAEALAGEGIEVAATPAAAARGAEAIGIVVTDDRAVESVLEGPDGVLAGLEPGALVIDMTTTSVASKPRSAELVRARGGRFVDSPVFGSRPQAEQGVLWAVVGADPADLPAARKFLGPLTEGVLHVGDVGAGAAVKLAGNLLVFAMVNGLAEAVALTEAHGIDPACLLEIVGRTGFRSPYFDVKGRQMIEGDYTPRFAVDNAVKDLRLITEAAAEAGLRLASTEAAKAVFEQASAAGLGGEDMTALVKVLRRVGKP